MHTLIQRASFATLFISIFFSFSSHSGTIGGQLRHHLRHRHRPHRRSHSRRRVSIQTPSAATTARPRPTAQAITSSPICR